MSKINNINIQINLKTLPLPQKGFGTPLILGVGATAIAYAEVIEEAELVLLGYLTTDAEYIMAQKIFSQNNRVKKLAVVRRISTDTITVALNDLVLNNKNSWYCLLITERTTAAIQEAGDWIASKKKLFIAGSTDKAVLTGRNNIREAYLIHSAANTDYPDAAWAGECLPEDPGSITWAFKRLLGMVESGFNTTDTNQILTDNGNYLGLLNGIVATYDGKTTGGEWIDIIRGRDFVDARINESMARLLLLNKKIPYTIRGFNLVAAEIRLVLKDVGHKGIVARVANEDDQTRSDNGEYQFIVTVPDTLDNIPANDRANRIEPVTFSFRAAGAVHVLDIVGTVTV